MTQFSLFGAAVAEPVLDDLGGVLLAGGHWVRSGDTARLSVVVADRWRADALAAEFALRGVAAPDDEAIVPAEGGWGVRTAFATELEPHAAAWTRGATEGPPAGFELTAAGLRLWTLAVGRHDEAGYLLATAETNDPVHRAGGAQLSRLGVAAASIVQRGGPGWRVTSLKRVRRLAELVGAAPAGAGNNWPQAR
jgi:hypothetical protein